MKKLILLTGVFFWVLLAAAQACLNSPVECPVQYYLTVDHIEDSLSRLGNPVVPQEVSMEYRLRAFTKDLVFKLAERAHWPEPILLEEGGASGFRNAEEGVLDYPLRPPHWYKIIWQFVVNKDSLDAWTAWLKDFSDKQITEMRAYASKASDPQGAYMTNYDSAKYYGDQESNYISSHIQAYQQALMQNDKAEIQRYEKAVAAYDKKINSFGNKAGESANQDHYLDHDHSMDNEREKKTLQFREASILHIEFDFNEQRPTIYDNEFRPIHLTAPTPPQATMAQAYFNPEATRLDNVHTYTHSKNIYWILLGGHYKATDGQWFASFGKDKLNIDKTSFKKTKSDQIQSIGIICSGNKKAIDLTSTDLNWSALNGMLTRP